MSGSTRVLTVARGAALVLLASGALLCGVGCLATFEPMEGSTQWVWRVVYGAGAGACSVLVVALLADRGSRE